jgi:hypothetical protein
MKKGLRLMTRSLMNTKVGLKGLRRSRVSQRILKNLENLKVVNKKMLSSSQDKRQEKISQTIILLYTTRKSMTSSYLFKK